MPPTDPQIQTLRLYAELITRRETLAGTLTFAHGAQSSATGLPAAVSIAGGATLLLDPDTAAVKSVFRTGGLDFVVNTLDEAVRVLKNEVRKHTPLASPSPPTPPHPRRDAERGIQPDLEVLIGTQTPTTPSPQSLSKQSTDSSSRRAALAWLAARNWTETWLPTKPPPTANPSRASSREPPLPPRRHPSPAVAPAHLPLPAPAPKSRRAIWLSPSEQRDIAY